MARDCTVLDVACGEGYGSALLADSGAKYVLGLDISRQAIGHARNRYQYANLSFARADCSRLPVPDGSIDLVVSFETLEHVHQQASMLDEFARVLAADGKLLISSPDKRVYSDASGFDNEFHVHELYREEFEQMLGQRFEHVSLYGQKLVFQSMLWALGGSSGCFRVQAMQDGVVREQKQPPYDPVYLIALCSNAERAAPFVAQTGLSLFGDLEESVYKHYNAEVRHHIESGVAFSAMKKRVAELEAAAVSTQSATGFQFRRWIKHLFR